MQSPESGSNKVYTEEQVAEHASKDVGVWVTYKGGVYDVTDWVSTVILVILKSSSANAAIYSIKLLSAALVTSLFAALQASQSNQAAVCTSLQGIARPAEA